MKNKQICVSVLLLFLTAAAAVPAAPAATSQVLAMDNPAAVYCTDVMGYEYQIVDDADGGQRGVCVLPGGQACDQWEFYAGACGQEFGYCAQQGYQTETRTDGQDAFATHYAVCLSVEGQEIGSVIELSDLIARSTDACADDACAQELPPIMDTDTPPPQIGPAAPSSFDWRSYGGVNWLTAVRDQKNCGSCWAFAAVGVVEAHYNIVKNNANLDLNLAEQDLVSCS